MMKRYRIYLTIIILLNAIHHSAYNQLTRPGKPAPQNKAESIPVYEFSDIKVSERSDRGDSLLLKPARSGVLIPVEFTLANSGIWDTLNDGTRIWRIGFTVENATFLNVLFAPFKLSSGVRVYLYNNDRSHTIGALSDLNNKPFNRLATSNIPGNSLFVEVQVPAYADSPGEIGIEGIGCDFSTDVLKKDEYFGSSGECNQDITCIDDTLVKTVSNSVVRIVFLGHQRCTGTLINSTSNRGSYILTAGHCFENEEEANTAVFYFNYESPYCGGPDGRAVRSISGATLRARSDDIDFALLELLEPVPYTYHPYYAGWDYRQITPQSGFIIHHPLGDVKKISIEEHPLSIADFGSLYNDNNHWLVSHWESGTTEAGSSGAPFFDSSGRIKGTLTGGLANCRNPVKDYFQMFSHSWKDVFSPEEQLAIWLDPANQAEGFLDGSDPYADFRSTADTLTNINPEEELNTESSGLLWGSWSGHNNLGTNEFAEKYQTSAQLITGVNLYVDRNYISRSQRSLDIVVWSGSSEPGEIIYQQPVPLANLLEDTVNFIEFDSAFSPGNTFFVGYRIYYLSSQDTFSVYMASNRSPDGISTAYVSEGAGWQNLTDYSSGSVESSLAVFPVVYGERPHPTGQNKQEDITLYPNPANSYFQIRFNEMKSDPVNVSIINMNGQTVSMTEYDSYQHIIPIRLERFANGIYIVKVKRGTEVYNLKLAIVK